MVFVVALAIGVAVSLTRSVASIVLSAALIGVAFAAAALLSPAGASLVSLLLAIAGFNSAFAGQVALLLLLQKPRVA
ncbi:MULTISPECIES: hypothetical protein [Rhizobium]|uniref:Uncharacterized protein n=2 Tax=Rhizobium TaxID=379 RepID=A0AAF1KQR4_9HYPH|nr:MULTISPECIES: hypothetical protein [Rhizobium]MBZ5759628.1 hypothetical protein [Rhizobium sp. VS19-DR96]MBZ5766017.1 hypothetical protein [Rhizobium sp. VS19-DR129.2]MBZ5772800.1 hypothetical protein [Rhizobium sp. VS19-DRK62.2]MBZ5786539.1 hypothetical protein [Rhizobium sp. VS19-DR121]MBZ5804813.1 hypothetical protein [Rhizobium sp. VS19-DR181]